MIDLHCHVLPGIDDGPREMKGSLALARAAIDAGVTKIVATPHVNSRTPNDADTIARLTDTTNERLAAEGLDLRIVPGAEIALSHLAEIEPAELTRLSLGGSGWLLMEPPFTPIATGLEGLVLGLLREGHRVVLAHPERCPALQRDRQIVRSLADAGVLMSITAGSLVGRFGGQVRAFALQLAREGLVHNVTSDAHDTVRRPPGLAREIKQARLTSLTDWLTVEVPAAILENGEIPSPPSAAATSARKGSRRFRLRRR